MGMAMGKDDKSEPTAGSSLEDEHLTDAFDAAAKGDRKAFISSMRSAIRACVDSYDTDDEETSEA